MQEDPNAAPAPRPERLDDRLYIRENGGVLRELDAAIAEGPLAALGVDRSAVIRWLIRLFLNKMRDKDFQLLEAIGEGRKKDT